MSLAPTVRSSAVLAAVRDATPGFAAADESCTAPFTHRQWLFSHGGALADWPRARKGLVDRTLEVPEAAAPVDSALLFGLAAAAWVAGADLAEGLTETVRHAVAHGGGRVNLAATDGTTAAATSYGDPLFSLETDTGVTLASEPWDDDPAWRLLPDGCVASTDGHTVSVVGLGV